MKDLFYLIKKLSLNFVQLFGWVLVITLFVVILAQVSPLFKSVKCTVIGFIGQNSSYCPSIQNPSALNPIYSMPEKDSAMSDTMTALATTVAVITLALTLGLPLLFEKINELSDLQNKNKIFFDKQQYEFEKQRKQIEIDNDRRFAQMDEILVLQKQLLNLQALWVDAQAAIVEWFNKPNRGTNFASASAIQLIGLRLQALQSNDEMTRREAFAYLDRQVWPKLSDAQEDFFRKRVQNYAEACHQYHAWRLWGMSSEDSLCRGGGLGLWCLFWDKTERTKFDETPPQHKC